MTFYFIKAYIQTKQTIADDSYAIRRHRQVFTEYDLDNIDE